MKLLSYRVISELLFGALLVCHMCISSNLSGEEKYTQEGDARVVWAGNWTSFLYYTHKK